MQKEYYKIFLLVMLSSDLTQKSNAQLGRPYFGSNSPLYGAKLRSNARGMPWVGGVGGRWAVMELTGALQSYQLLRQRVRQFNLCPANKQETERYKLNLVTVLLK